MIQIMSDNGVLTTQGRIRTIRTTPYYVPFAPMVPVLLFLPLWGARGSGIGTPGWSLLFMIARPTQRKLQLSIDNIHILT